MCRRIWLDGLHAVLAMLVLGGASFAAFSDDRHVGVADCAGSTCHAATRPFADRQIRLDEYFLWQRKDRHADAYKTLLGERSRAIAARLGWGEAHEAEGCLVCHTHAPPVAQRGERFRVEDGIGCEACHGAAERWLAPHVDGIKGAAERVRLGMFPTWEAKPRAELCLSCHQGDAGHPITHAIMAAGHPPLLFELDTFLALMPPHHDVDQDYVQRKGRIRAVAQWATGQTVAAGLYLDELAAGRYRDGLFPELALFDCDACHHPMSEARGQPQRAPGLEPGSVPLADSALVMVGLILAEVDSAAAARWRTGLTQLYRSLRAPGAELATAAQSLRAQLGGSARTLAAHSWSAAQVERLTKRMVAVAAGPHSGHFAFAEQASMALVVLSATAVELGSAERPGLRAATDTLYATLQQRDHFDPAAYRAALAQVERALQ